MKICFHRAAGLCAAAAILAVSCGKTQPDTPDPGTLSAPVLKIENVSETSALLTWEAVEGASEYTLQLAGPEDYERELTVKETEYELTGLEPETGYSARIMALASGDEHESSAWSEWQEFTTAGPMIADAFAGGSGTQEDPYLIAKASQLALLAKYVNEETPGYFEDDVHYRLTADIDLGGYGNWTPIGSGPTDGRYPYENPRYAFQGVFDGDGHLVSGLNVALSGTTTFTSAGLFGVNDGTIRNLNVSGNVHATTSNENKGTVAAGGIAGFNIIAYADATNPSPGSGAIEHCSFSGSVSASCGPDKAGTADAGGICGMAESGNIDYCSVTLGDSDSIVTSGGATSMAGGIAGAMMGGRITYCSLSGSGAIEAGFNAPDPEGYYVYAQIGGIVGSVNDGDLQNCTVDYSGSLSVPEGGVANVNMGLICGNSYASISGCSVSFAGETDVKSGGTIAFGGIAGLLSNTSATLSMSDVQLGGTVGITQTDEYCDVHVGGIYGMSPYVTTSACEAVISSAIEVNSAVTADATNVNIGGIAGYAGVITAGCSAEWTAEASVSVVADRSNFGGVVGLTEPGADSSPYLIGCYAICDADVTLEPAGATDFTANAGGIAGDFSGLDYFIWNIPAYMTGCYAITDGVFTVGGQSGGRGVAGASEAAEFSAVFWGSHDASLNEDLVGTSAFESLDRAGFEAAIEQMNSAILASQVAVVSFVYDPVKGVPVLAR